MKRKYEAKPHKTTSFKRYKRDNNPWAKESHFYDKKKFAHYKSPRPTMPQELVTTFRYTDFRTVSAAAATFAFNNFETNAYDVDPLLASTAMPYFTELSTMYSRFRTLRMTYSFECSNNENFPLLVQTGFTNEVSITPNTDFSGNPLWKSTMIAAKGGMDKCKMKDSKSICEIVGTQMPLYDDTFTGSTISDTMSSLGKCYAYFVINTGTASFPTNGVSLRVQISLTVNLYRSHVLSS